MRRITNRKRPAKRIVSLAILVGSVLPALLFLAPSSFSSAAAQSARAQVPDDLVLARLVWSTMLTVDNANRTGNYAVLRALGSTDFQRANSVQNLTLVFADLRQNQVDVGKAMLSTPQYYYPPAIDKDGYLRTRGWFNFGANSLRFDLMFENTGAGWQIAAISIGEFNPATDQ